jgi:Phospholipase_D-nuclease N-terminal
MSFWDIVWFIFITWAFVAYLMVMFSIIGDIFRDQDMSGWVKALWCLLLVFLPFITALVYIGVRGRSMAERSARAAEAHQQQQDAHIRRVASGRTTPTDEIAQARALFDAGAISQSEYDVLKAKALGPSADAPAVPRARAAAGDTPALDQSGSAERR